MAFNASYVLAEAQEAITLSGIAYQGEGGDYDTIKTAIISALASSTVLDGHLKLVWLGIGPDLANLLYVAHDDREPARYALVSRGTDWDFLLDWVEDFDILHTHDWPSANPPDPSIVVAQGPWDGLPSLLAAASQPDGLTLLDLLKQISATTELDLFITGHSLGGALATVLGLYLADTVGNWAGAAVVSLKSYTFASPTIGNQAYADYYNGRSALPNTSWQAFRVLNEQDVVPFAYADVEGIAESGIPLSPTLSVAVSAFAVLVQAALDKDGVSYVQVGRAQPLSNRPPVAAPPSADPAATLDDFARWVGYEHSCLTYLSLLGAATQGLQDRSIDLSMIASTRRPRLETKLAAARAAASLQAHA